MVQKGLSSPMTVIGMVNGMIGGIILIMPILALKTGTALIAPITIIFGLFSYFSCLLCLRHLRNYPDLDQSVLRHFNNNRKYKVFYDAIIIISLSVLLILYFGLICDMWGGITGSKSPLIPILNAMALFPIVYVMKKFHFGAKLLAYGILSIIAYCIFLAWMLATTQQGQKTVPVADNQFINLGAALAQGFAIQTFFIPILKQNPSRRLYGKLLIIAYIIGIIVYTYIGYSGSASIVNLHNQSQKPQAQEIGDFFEPGKWQVIVIYIIYLSHLYSAFPEFLLIAKKRFFSILKQPQTDDVRYKQVIYVAVTIFVCLAIQITQVQPKILIQINGSIVSFFFIYVIPIVLHIKCVYFTKPQDRIHKITSESQLKHNPDQDMKQQAKPQMQSSQIIRKQLEMGTLPSKKQYQDFKQQQMSDNNKDTEDKTSLGGQPSTQYNCCDIKFKSKAHQICEAIIILLMLLSGLFTMGYTVYLMFAGHNDGKSQT